MHGIRVPTCASTRLVSAIFLAAATSSAVMTEAALSIRSRSSFLRVTTSATLVPMLAVGFDVLMTSTCCETEREEIDESSEVGLLQFLN